ncbi:REP-associated tyrosine transposase [Marinimicrobium sp. C2-29]|uniref:REP-associated tyrosine transposase n=1 Tax=Marinimicrobium sp. C2-29 TaxID=3139825 RepID=UPI003138DFD9
MPHYRRNYLPGGTYFFTVTLSDRQSDWLVQYISTLRDAVRRVQQTRPFTIDAWCVLPEHLHAIWTLPAHDADYSNRWREIKKIFSKTVVASERLPRQIDIWQQRFWEHTIVDERDYRQHLDYVHFNPVKHGWVNRVQDWPYSTFHRAVREGLYPLDWGGGESVDMRCGERGE